MDVADPALQAARLLAIDPQGLGGLCLRGPPGPARDAVLAQLRAALPADTPWRRLPAQIDDERLLGGLDLGLSLAAGRPVAQAGLLAEVAGGVLLLPMAEHLSAELAGRLALALDSPGSGLCCVALDEGQDEQERPPAILTERLALIVSGSQPVEAADPAPPFDLAAARQRLAQIPYDEACVQAFCVTAAALGLHSLRAPWQAWRAACAAAALAGRERVAQEDAELAARLVLAPRARALPAADEPAQAEQPSPPDSAPEPPPTPETEASTPDAGESEQRSPDLQEQVIEAAKAAIPPGLLAWLSNAQGAAQRATGSSSGRSGAASRPARSGRPLSSRRGSLRAGARLDLLATLRAAIPWQRLRLQERERAGLVPSPAKLLLRRDDFHIKRYRRPRESTTIFAVDASGSQALTRLAEAKGAVELLLADCYVRRDRVALIAFRGESAQTLLAPTRSLVRARRSLSALPGGGGTPLAAGIDAACALGQSVQARDGAQALLVFLTDARANIASDGSPGRALAMQDALAAAARLQAQGLRSVLIDTSPRPQPQAMLLAQAMAARYVPLPQGQAADVHAAVVGGR